MIDVPFNISDSVVFNLLQLEPSPPHTPHSSNTEGLLLLQSSILQYFPIFELSFHLSFGITPSPPHIPHSSNTDGLLLLQSSILQYFPLFIIFFHSFSGTIPSPPHIPHSSNTEGLLLLQSSILQYFPLLIFSFQSSSDTTPSPPHIPHSSIISLHLFSILNLSSISISFLNTVQLLVQFVSFKHDVEGPLYGEHFSSFIQNTVLLSNIFSHLLHELYL